MGSTVQGQEIHPGVWGSPGYYRICCERPPKWETKRSHPTPIHSNGTPVKPRTVEGPRPGDRFVARLSRSESAGRRTNPATSGEVFWHAGKGAAAHRVFEAFSKPPYQYVWDLCVSQSNVALSKRCSVLLCKL